MNTDPAKNSQHIGVAPSEAPTELPPTPASTPAAAVGAPAAAATPAVQLPQPPRPGEDLHVCRRCYSELVYPVDWAEAGPVHWEVSLRCPECWGEETGVFPQSVVERFDIELDRGAEILLRDLQHLAHANMADYIERFTKALRGDHLLPADF